MQQQLERVQVRDRSSGRTVTRKAPRIAPPVVRDFGMHYCLGMRIFATVGGDMVHIWKRCVYRGEPVLTGHVVGAGMGYWTFDGRNIGLDPFPSSGRGLDMPNASYDLGEPHATAKH